MAELAQGLPLLQDLIISTFDCDLASCAVTSRGLALATSTFVRLRLLEIGSIHGYERPIELMSLHIARNISTRLPSLQSLKTSNQRLISVNCQLDTTMASMVSLGIPKLKEFVRIEHWQRTNMLQSLRRTTNMSEQVKRL